MSKRFSRWVRHNANVMLLKAGGTGQGLIEYALILMLVAIIVIVIVAVFGSAVGNLYSNVINAI